MKALFILNDPSYGTERVYNALRLAQALFKKEPQREITVFLSGFSCCCKGRTKDAGWVLSGWVL